MLRSGTRPVLLQQAFDMRKRLKGPPEGGDVASIVVTDIQGVWTKQSDVQKLHDCSAFLLKRSF
jgi:hypothetical protein